jgi:hypothetical protein
VLSLVIAGQAFAVTWNPRIALSTSSNGSGGGLVTMGSSNAVAIYTDTGRTYTRRSTNSGATWQPRVQLSGKGTWFTAIAGRGTTVDAVWSRTADFDQDGFLNYRRSTDSGATFAPVNTLASMTDPGGFVLYAPGAAHGAGNRVAVAWHEMSSTTNRFQVRVSTDGGLTFGAAVPLGNSTVNYSRPPAVAIGTGVIYVAYFIDQTTAQLRRSTNNGATWTPAVTLATDGYGDGNIYALSMVANGSAAHFAYAAKSGAAEWVRYRRTSNKGVNWTAVSNLSPATGNDELRPVLSLVGGVLRVVYESCENAACDGQHVTYRRRASGAWTAEEEASHPSADWASPSGLGYAGRVIVLYDADHYRSIYDANMDVYVRTGT